MRLKQDTYLLPSQVFSSENVHMSYVKSVMTGNKKET